MATKAKAKTPVEDTQPAAPVVEPKAEATAQVQWPEVTVGIVTYNRYEEIRQTVQALADGLIYPPDRLKWVIADDSSPDGYTERLGKLKLFEDLNARFITTPENAGWGANVNNLRANLETDYLFLIEDDYVLTEDIDLRAGIALMEARPDIGYVRYRGTAGHHILYHGFEADISAQLPEFRQGLGLPGRINYLQMDSNSPEVYLYSNGPHLVHRRFIEFYGPYEEGRKLGETEERYAHTVRDRMKLWNEGAPALVILPEFVHQVFDHIGTSYQHTEADK